MLKKNPGSTELLEKVLSLLYIICIPPPPTSQVRTVKAGGGVEMAHNHYSCVLRYRMLSISWRLTIVPCLHRLYIVLCIACQGERSHWYVHHCYSGVQYRWRRQNIGQVHYQACPGGMKRQPPYHLCINQSHAISVTVFSLNIHHSKYSSPARNLSKCILIADNLPVF